MVDLAAGREKEVLALMEVTVWGLQDLEKDR